MINKLDKNELRIKRHARVRNKVFGTSSSPRLNVYRSLTHVYAQIIDDTKGITLASASTIEKAIKDKIVKMTRKEQAFFVGEQVAMRAIEKGIKTVVFDRGGYIYTGRVAQVAEGARKGGLEL
ncbi:MAG: 50S ribosomal protein L18 [Bacilli bacterium]